MQRGNLNLPDFLIIGAAKAGTTTIHDYLAEHPRIFMSRTKEPQFFSANDTYCRGITWYARLFQDARPDQVCGESSTTYTRHPHTADAPRQIARDLPEAKLIYALRDPIDRAFSHYCHHMRDKVSCTFEEAVKRDNIYIDCSMYALQLERYLNYFPKEQFHFVIFEELVSRLTETMEATLRFLNIHETKTNVPHNLHSNERHQEFIHARTTKRLRRLPGGNLLAESLPQSLKNKIHRAIRRSPIGQRLEREHHIPPMRTETRARLLEFFQPHNDKLFEFLGRPIRQWQATTTPTQIESEAN